MSQYNNNQIMMTLAQLSAVDPDARPSGETTAAQAARMLNGIQTLLADSSLATGGQWSTDWLALSPDGGNLIYVATCTSLNAFAVCIRGTQFTSLVDLGEDMAVSNVAQFAPGSTPASPPLLVSTGAMKAFTDSTGATGADGNNLLQTLTSLLNGAPASPAPVVYVTGHSLGGAIATMVALYLAELAAEDSLPNKPVISAYTFAAPTAGLSAFAASYDAVVGAAPNSAYRIYNQYDAVPYAWADLTYVKSNFYPAPTYSKPTPAGPQQTFDTGEMLKIVMKMPGSNLYIQTNGNSSTGQNTLVLNTGYTTWDTAFTSPTTGAFLGQIGYQHNCYLLLLNAPPMPGPGASQGVPVVTSLSQNTGPAAGGGSVTISGGTFTAESVVDFGNVPATVTSWSPTQMVVTQPALAGTVSVRVTNIFGTSAAVPACQFAAPPLAAPTVFSVNPTSGPVMASGDTSYTVTVTGTGFYVPQGTDYSVSFGGTAGTDVTVLSLTQLTVVPPATGASATPLDITVTDSAGTSAPNAGGQFLLGPPIVTGVNPISGPGYATKKSKIVPVTVSGYGFVASKTTVQFGKNAGTDVNVVSDTSLTVTPPTVKVVTNETVDVTVTVGALTSEVTTADEYVMYPPELF